MPWPMQRPSFSTATCLKGSNGQINVCIAYLAKFRGSIGLVLADLFAPLGDAPEQEIHGESAKSGLPYSYNTHAFSLRAAARSIHRTPFPHHPHEVEIPRHQPHQ